MDVAAFMSRYEAILKERKIKKMQFYKDCGFTDAAVSQWRKGKNIPSMKNIKTIADYLDVTVEYLLTGNSEQKEKPTTVVGSELNAERIKLMLSKMSDAELIQLIADASDILRKKGEE